jgi:hypothetical protein
MLTKQERLETKVADLDRQLSIAQGQERAFKTTLRTSENAVRSLRDETTRLKLNLQQVRAQCANDLRKRDVLIQRLKKQVTDQQRGTRPATSLARITVIPPVARLDEVSSDQNDYSLKQETNDFLTSLCQQMSDETDNLIGLIRSTLLTLKALQGLPINSTEVDYTGEGSFSGHAIVPTAATVLQSSYESLSSDLDDVLEHLRSLLTNPSFVPVEELHSRDEEITRLKEGRIKIESKWKEAIKLMEGWRKRLAQGGSSVNLDELRLGVRMDHEDLITMGVNAPPEIPHTDELPQDEVGELEHSVEEDEDEHEALGIGLSSDGNVLSELNHNVGTTRKAIPVNFGDESVSESELVASSPKTEGKASRIPRHRPNTTATSPRTIKRKLETTHAEADAARKKRVTSNQMRVRSETFNSKRAARRRSTLSPQELESLMKGHAGS